MAEALYYISDIVSASQLNHNKDSRHASSITASHVQVQTCADTVEHKTSSKNCLKNTILLAVCPTAL